MNIEKYLPLGTVVMLKNGKKRLMITGFCITPNNDDGVMFDYSGVIFPEGMISSDQTALFNHEQIERVDYLGLVDDEEKKFKTKLNELVKSNVGTNTVLSNEVELPMTSQTYEKIESFDDLN